MKKILKNTKYIAFSLTLFAALFAMTKYADACVTYGAAGQNGTITSCVDILNAASVPTTNFPASTTFKVSAYIVSGSSTSENVSLTATNNSGTSFTIIPVQTIGPGSIIPSVIVTVPTSTPSAMGTYPVVFSTNVDVESAIYVRVVEVSRESGTWYYPGSCQGPFYPGGTYFPYENVVERADFYSDPGGTIPLDVTGLNLRLKQEHYINFPTWVSTVPGTEISYTGILSGTSYEYQGPSWSDSYTDGWGSSSCDIQHTVSGFSTLDGSSVSPTPYLFVLTPPIASISAPSQVYTGGDFSVVWSSSPSTSCTGTNFSTGGAGGGSVPLTMNGTTTYTVNCSNALGSISDSVTVTDIGPPPPPPAMCNGYDGPTSCPAPAYCSGDPGHPGFEMCQY